MNWSAVKNFLITILIAANVFLVFNIVKQERARGYIPEENIDAAIELLSERGFDVPKGCVPTERFAAPVYESMFSDAYYTDVAQTLTGSPRELLLSPPEGGFSITLKNGAVVDFDSEFGFTYRKNDKLNSNAYTEITAENFTSESALWDDINSSKMKTLSDLTEDFLEACTPDNRTMHARVADGYYDSESGYSCILAYQMIDSFEVYSHYAVCVFYGEELVYAGGRWYFAPLGKSYRADLIDQVNILFYDFNVLSERANTAYSVAEYSDDENVPVTFVEKQSEERKNLPPVNNITPCYVIYRNADKTALYFIPAWQIKHIGSQDTVFNAANGTLYLIN